jgi:hypothetical protein
MRFPALSIQSARGGDRVMATKKKAAKKATKKPAKKGKK